MKKFILATVLILGMICPVAAQQTLNMKGDNIVGTYNGKQGDDVFKARITRLSDGTYQGQIIWMEHDRDANGQKILDKKNPDKSLRTQPADRIIVFSGLKYDKAKHHWGDTKIYDPQRGLRAKMTAEFAPDGRLRIKGSLLGISETVYWVRVSD